VTNHINSSAKQTTATARKETLFSKSKESDKEKKAQGTKHV
jgi:hypothetical protein